MAAPSTDQEIDYPLPSSNFQVPFLAWNRLEGRPRHEEFVDSLKMSVHDPLWMLCKQWQFGEFKAEDRGSAILAKMIIESKKITHFAAKDELGGYQSYPNAPEDIPLEVLVERLNPKLSITQKAELGRKFLQLAQTSNTNGGDTAGDNSATKSELLAQYTFQVPAEPTPQTWANQPTDTALHASEEAYSNLGLLAGRALDGWAIYEAAKLNPTSFLQSVPSFIGDASGLAGDFTAWLEETYNLPELSNWNDGAFQYESKVAHQLDDDSFTEMEMKPVHNGKVDWYAFDRKEGTRNDMPQSNVQGIDSEVITVLPSPARFKGMPNKRLWQLEDASVDFGNLDIERAEIVKEVLAEFSLVYGNDWFILPYTFELNQLTRMKAMLVTDVFGVNTLSTNSGDDNLSTTSGDEAWHKWSLFSQDIAVTADSLMNDADISSNSLDDSIWIPPASVSTMESEAMEEIYFVRDEIDNRVWAIETRVFDHFLGSVDGKRAAEEVRAFLNKLMPIDPTNEHYAELVYKLGDEVPHNWIPFIPIQKNDGRSIMLQRAAAPFTGGDTYEHIRPRTHVLRAGIDDQNNQEIPLFINEELISRSGLKVSDHYQKTRWYGGKTFLWYSRKKTIARYPVSSGLSFDNLEFRPKNQIQPWSPPIVGQMSVGETFEIK